MDASAPVAEITRYVAGVNANGKPAGSAVYIGNEEFLTSTAAALYATEQSVVNPYTRKERYAQRVATDPKMGFAVLRLVPLPPDPGSKMFSKVEFASLGYSVVPEAGVFRAPLSFCSVAYRDSQTGSVFVSQAAIGNPTEDAAPLLAITPRARNQSDLLGAPVFQKNKLVGIVKATAEHSVLMLPIDYIAQSSASRAIRRIIEMREPVASKSSDEQQLPAYSIQVSSIGDSPASTDALGFKPYVDAVARFLVSPDTKPPLTLSIEGEWGSGKSSFMLQLRNALPDELSVNFSPWRHDKGQSLWAAFALEFLRQVSRQQSFAQRWIAKMKLFLHHYGLRGRIQAVRGILVWLALLLLLFGVPYAVFVAKPKWTQEATRALSAKPTETEKPKEDSDPLLKILVLIGGNAAYLAVIFSIWIKAKEFVGNPLEIQLKEYLRSPNYDEQVTFIERFHEDFKRIVDIYAGERKVFVFIDDLDRCEVPKAADLMKAVNLLIADDPRLIFILGMDREKVVAGLAVKYEKILPYIAGEASPRAGLEFGHAFLEKFIQLPFRVPQPNLDQYQQFLESISTPAALAYASPENVSTASPQRPSDEDAPSAAPSQAPANAEPSAAVVEERRRREIKFAGDSEQVREIALMIARALDPNPRRLKQFINLFRLQAYIVNELGFFDSPDDQRITFPQLGKFVAIALKWPSLLADFAQAPILFRELQELATTPPPGVEFTPNARRWNENFRVRRFFSYGMQDNAAEYTMDNRALYQLLHICPRRSR